MALPDSLLHSRVTVDQNQSAAGKWEAYDRRKIGFFSNFVLTRKLVNVIPTYVRAIVDMSDTNFNLQIAAIFSFILVLIPPNYLFLER